MDGKDLLRATVRMILKETVSMFDEWLSPDIMEVLIREYAKAPTSGEGLKWKYAKLRDRVWGEFSADSRTLYVNQSKTKGLFGQQVETILHEIQHWNQFVEVGKSAGISPLVTWHRVYSQESKANGYWKNRFEVDARAFSKTHLEGAMSKLSKHYGGKVDGGSFDLAVEEIFDEHSDDGFVTRIQIGQALKAHDANSPDNMKKAITTLADLGIKVR